MLSIHQPVLVRWAQLRNLWGLPCETRGRLFRELQPNPARLRRLLQRAGQTTLVGLGLAGLWSCQGQRPAGSLDNRASNDMSESLLFSTLDQQAADYSFMVMESPNEVYALQLEQLETWNPSTRELVGSYQDELTEHTQTIEVGEPRGNAQQTILPVKLQLEQEVLTDNGVLEVRPRSFQTQSARLLQGHLLWNALDGLAFQQAACVQWRNPTTGALVRGLLIPAKQVNGWRILVRQ